MHSRSVSSGSRRSRLFMKSVFTNPIYLDVKPACRTRVRKSRYWQVRGARAQLA